MKFFYFYINNRCDWDWPSGTVVLKARDLTTFTKVRKDRNIRMTEQPFGWHMSYFGDAEDIAYKIGNLTDAISIDDSMKDKAWLEECLKERKDPLKRDIKWNLTTEIDCPKYMKDNLEKFRRYVYGS